MNDENYTDLWLCWADMGGVEGRRDRDESNTIFILIFKTLKSKMRALRIYRQ